VLAKATYLLAVGHAGMITLHLTAAGRRALAKAAHHQMKAALIVSLAGAVSTEGTALLMLVSPKHR
jgi:hypothetical protein